MTPFCRNRSIRGSNGVEGEFRALKQGFEGQVMCTTLENVVLCVYYVLSTEQKLANFDLYEYH